MSEPTGVYPPSTEAIREWFRRAHGREATELEIGELERALAKRQESEQNKEQESTAPRME